jgi:hypothetical protein
MKQHGKIVCPKISKFAIEKLENHDWLVVFRHPSEKSWSSSVGMIKFPRYGKITNVPSHQPDEREIYIYIMTIGFWGLKKGFNQ